MGRLTDVEQLVPSLADDLPFRRWFERAARLSVPAGPPVLEDEQHLRRRPAQRARFDPRTDPGRGPTSAVASRPRPATSRTTSKAPGAWSCPVRTSCPSRPIPGNACGVIEQFLTWQPPRVLVDRVLATVLFTDIVNSTGQAAQIGDRRWRELLAAHDTVIRGLKPRSVSGSSCEVHRRRRARNIPMVLPERIRCACAIRDAVDGAWIGGTRRPPHGRDRTAGQLHLELPCTSASGSRRSQAWTKCSSHEPLRIAGSEIIFRDHGEHDLKGVPGVVAPVRRRRLRTPTTELPCGSVE